jgi:hypothetical protein
MTYHNAHAVRIEDGIVREVIVIPYCNDNDTEITAYCNSIGLPGTWIDTSYTSGRRKNYAGIGYTFDEQRDAFIQPQPYQSWVLDEDTCLWEPPTPYPTDGGMYQWDEANGDWVTI